MVKKLTDYDRILEGIDEVEEYEEEHDGDYKIELIDLIDSVWGVKEDGVKEMLENGEKEGD